MGIYKWAKRGKNLKLLQRESPKVTTYLKELQWEIGLVGQGRASEAFMGENKEEEVISP